MVYPWMVILSIAALPEGTDFWSPTLGQLPNQTSKKDSHLWLQDGSRPQPNGDMVWMDQLRVPKVGSTLFLINNSQDVQKK